VEEDTPRIAATLERVRLFIAGVMLIEGLLAWLDHMPGFALVPFFGLATSLDAVRVLSTQVSSVGVSQLTWRGRIHLRWNDVTAIAKRKRSIVLTSTQGSVVVATESFYDTQAAIRYLDAHLPKHLVGQGTPLD